MWPFASSRGIEGRREGVSRSGSSSRVRPATLARMELVQEGGTPVLGLLCCALFSHPLAIAALVTSFASRSRLAVVALGGASLAIGVGAVLIGVGGFLYGMNMVEAALVYADPSQRSELLALGREEAMLSVWFGLATGAIPALAGLGVVARGLRLPRSAERGAR